VIPYFTSTQIPLGHITIQTWGLFVALGFIAGAFASIWLAKQRGLKSAVVWDVLGWIIFSSMIGARLFHIVFYEPTYYLANPLEILAVWHGGMSMVGGLIGAAVAGVGYLRYKKLDLLKHVDVLVFGLPLGYFIGRIGCFLIHDHPGIPTSFFLGVQYPDGIIRHDLGLYHSLLGLAIFIFFLIIKKKAPVGSFLIWFLILYGVARFFFDFLRINDVRFLALTPAQYFGILMALGGGLLYFRLRDKRFSRDS